MDATADRPLPVALLVVAGLFFAEGIMGVADLIVSLYYDSLMLNLEMLGIPIAYGLVKRRPGWRTTALVCLWIKMASCTCILGILLATSESFVWSRHQTVLFTISNPIAEALAVAGLILAIWRRCVLRRTNVRFLFGLPVSPVNASAPPPPTPPDSNCPTNI
jgi:hypothetical protein